MATSPNAVKVVGLKQAQAAFQQYPALLQERFRDATRATVQAIKARAKMQILASPSVRTRSLYNHIDATEPSKKSGFAKVGVTAGSSSAFIDPVSGKFWGIQRRGGGSKVVTPSRYAHLVEFGSRHMAAEPFMLPAARAEQQPHLERIREAGKASEADAAKIGMAAV